MIPNNSSAVPFVHVWDAAEVFSLLLVITFTVLGVVGNIFVIMAWYSDSHISANPSNVLLLSLAFTDLAVAVFGIPFSHVFKIVGRWIFGEASKLLLIFVTQSAVLVSSWHLVLVAVDRYRIVTEGLDYLHRRTVRSVLEPIPWLWFIGFWEITPMLVVWPKLDLLSFDKDLGDLTTQSVWVTIKNPTFVLLHLLLSTLLPILLLIVLYWKTFRELRTRLRKKLPKAQPNYSTTVDEETGKEKTSIEVVEMENSSSGDELEKEETKPPTERAPPAVGIQEVMEKKHVHLSYKKERKTAITLGILILAFLLCWVPFLVVNLLYVVSVESPDGIHWMTKFLGMINSCVNPVIYAFSSQDYNRAFKKIIRVNLARTQPRLNFFNGC